MAKTSKYQVPVEASAVITSAGAFTSESTTENKSSRYQSVYPVLIYEGKNYLPTAYGYKSFFGINGITVNGMPEAEVVHDTFMYQTQDLINYPIALTDSGIWVGLGPSTSAPRTWTKLLNLAVPPEGTSFRWTHCNLAHKLFLYREDQDSVFWIEEIIDGVGIYLDDFNGSAVTPTQLASIANCSIEVYKYTPTVLNMAGQLGIYRAGASLGFWDSDNSIAFSAINDPTDFAPSLSTLANLTKINRMVGRITHILASGRDFIVYSTTSIIRMVEYTGSTTRFTAETILDSVGVSYPGEIAASNPDTTHYAWTSAGLMEITGAKAEVIIPGISDFMEEMKGPVYIGILNSRYLVLQVQDPNFIPGNVEFSSQTVDPVDYEFGGVTSPGATEDGYVVDGGDACFDPEEFSEKEAGIKPYVILPLYNAWLYSGASIADYFKFETSVGRVSNFELTKGSVHSNYNTYYPFKVNTDTDLAAFEQNQIDQWIDAQLATLVAKYSESTQTALTATADALADLHTNNTALKELESATVTSSAVQISTPVASPENAVMQFHFSEAPSTALPLDNNSAIAEWAGNSPVIRPNFGAIFLSGRLENPTPESAEEIKHLGHIKLVEKADIIVQPKYDKAYFLANVNNALYTTEVYTYNTPIKLYRSVPETIEVAATFSGANNYDSSFYRIDYRCNNDAAGTYRSGAFAIYLITSASETTLSVNLGMPAADAITAAFALFDRPEVENLPLPLDDPDFPLGAPQNQSAFTNSQAYTSDYLVELSIPLISTAIAEVIQDVQVRDAYNIQQNGGIEGWYVRVSLGVGQYSYEPIVSGSVSEIESLAGSSTYVYDHIVSTARSAIANANPTTNTWAITTLGTWPYIELNPPRVKELYIAAEDANEKLYGQKSNASWYPPNPPTDKPVFLDPADYLGVMAVEEYFYNRNRDPYVLDRTFLIGAANRIEVPLGWSVAEADAAGAPTDVTASANWGNRYKTTISQGVGDGTSYNFTQGMVCGVAGDYPVEGVDLPPIVWDPWEIETGQLTYVLSNGLNAPYDPTFYGGYVFDSHLKKWGQFQHEYKSLMDYQAINNQKLGALDLTGFHMEAGLHKPTGETTAFDHSPTESYVRYGKFKRISSERTQIQRVDVTFKNQSNGILGINWSLNGRDLEYAYSNFATFAEALSKTLHCDKVGQWATITIAGNYDISGISIKYNGAGDR